MGNETDILKVCDCDEDKYVGVVQDDSYLPATAEIGTLIGVKNSAQANNKAALFYWSGTQWVIFSSLDTLNDYYTDVEVDALLAGLGIYSFNILVGSPLQGYLQVTESGGNYLLKVFNGTTWNTLATTSNYILLEALLSTYLPNLDAWRADRESFLTKKSNISDVLTSVGDEGSVRFALDDGNGNPIMFIRKGGAWHRAPVSILYFATITEANTYKPAILSSGFKNVFAYVESGGLFLHFNQGTGNWDTLLSGTLNPTVNTSGVITGDGTIGLPIKLINGTSQPNPSFSSLEYLIWNGTSWGVANKKDSDLVVKYYDFKKVTSDSNFASTPFNRTQTSSTLASDSSGTFIQMSTIQSWSYIQTDYYKYVDTVSGAFFPPLYGYFDFNIVDIPLGAPSSTLGYFTDTSISTRGRIGLRHVAGNLVTWCGDSVNAMGGISIPITLGVRYVAEFYIFAVGSSLFMDVWLDGTYIGQDTCAFNPSSFNGFTNFSFGWINHVNGALGVEAKTVRLYTIGLS